MGVRWARWAACAPAQSVHTTGAFRSFSAPCKRCSRRFPRREGSSSRDAAAWLQCERALEAGAAQAAGGARVCVERSVRRSLASAGARCSAHTHLTSRLAPQAAGQHPASEAVCSAAAELWEHHTSFAASPVNEVSRPAGTRAPRWITRPDIPTSLSTGRVHALCRWLRRWLTSASSCQAMAVNGAGAALGFTPPACAVLPPLPNSHAPNATRPAALQGGPGPRAGVQARRRRSGRAAAARHAAKGGAHPLQRPAGLGGRRRAQRRAGARGAGDAGGLHPREPWTGDRRRSAALALLCSCSRPQHATVGNEKALSAMVCRCPNRSRQRSWRC